MKIGYRNSAATLMVIVGLSPGVPASSGFAQEAKLRETLLEVSKSDKDATGRMLNLFLGGEDKALGIKKGCYSAARRRVSWLAFGELFYHPLSSTELEQTLAYIKVLQRYPANWPKPMRWKQASKSWGDHRIPDLVEDMSNADESVRLKALLEAQLNHFRWAVSRENARKLRDAGAPLRSHKNESIQLEAWSLMAHWTKQGGDDDLILETLKTATGRLRTRILQTGLTTAFGNVNEPCLKQVREDLGGSDQGRKDAAFLATSIEWASISGDLSKKDKKTLQTLALHYVASKHPEFVFAAMRVLDSTTTVEPSRGPTELARALEPVAGNLDPYVRERLISLVQTYCGKTEAGRKILTGLTKDLDAGVRNAAKKALE